MRSVASFVLALALVAACNGAVSDATSYEREFHSVVPLGAERIDLRPAGRTMYILATAESPTFEGWRARDDGNQRTLLRADGTPVRFFPQHVDFRLTATAMRPDLLMIDTYGTLNLSQEDINDYLLQMNFRLLVFHGLDITRIEPQAVRMLGMPADVQYDERIWQLSFDLPKPVPTTDHIVLEVLSSTGYRVCKFHLEFF